MASFVDRPGTRFLSVVVLALATTWGTVALTVDLLAVVRQRPLHGGLAWVLAGIPILFFGQAWTIVLLNGMRGRADDMLLRVRAYEVVGGVLLAASFVSAATAFGELGRGGPTQATAGCPYPLNNHGSITCTDAHHFAVVSAAEQRTASGITAVFFLVHAGVAARDLRRRRAAPSTPP